MIAARNETDSDVTSPGCTLVKHPVLNIMEFFSAGMLGALVKPTDDRHAANQQEIRKQANILLCQLAMQALTVQQSLLQFTKIRIKRAFGQQ